MLYRKFGKLNWDVSVLGFGAMRLPLLDNNPAHVDEEESVKMIRYAIDHGVNYVDTAYPYHQGSSEVAVGKALKNGYRQKIKLATKMPVFLVQTAADFDRLFNEQLHRLDTDKVDLYLMHGIHRDCWPKVRDLGVLAWAEKRMSEGRIGHLGFSFHDDYATFQNFIGDYDNWTFCQFQYNYLDENYQAGTAGLKYAAAKGLAVVIMEPLRGGGLTTTPPPAIVKIWESAPQKRSLAEWGLRWVWNHPEVSVVLSGMTKMEQVKENIAIAEHALPNSLTARELSLINRVQEAFHGLIPIPCTSCRYCMPCAQGVNIPRIFTLYNEAVAYGTLKDCRMRYTGYRDQQHADWCIECGECVEKCPQHIEIPEWLKKAHTLLKAQ